MNTTDYDVILEFVAIAEEQGCISRILVCAKAKWLV